MTTIQIILIALVQGITEVFPISSSAHLILFKSLLGVEQNLALDVFLHLGSLVGLLIFFRTKIIRIVLDLIKLEQHAKRLVLNLILTTIPIVAVFLLLGDDITKLREAQITIFTLFLGGVLLLLIYKMQGKKEIQTKQAFLMGLFQTASFMPGVSRSGSVLIGGKILKIDEKQLYDYIFLAAIPVIIGAVASQADAILNSNNKPELVLGFLVAAASTYLTLMIFFKIIRNPKTIIFFGIYRIALSSLILLTLLI